MCKRLIQKKTKVFVIISALMLLLLVGCSTKNDILLRWNTSEEGVNAYRTFVQQKITNTQKVAVDISSLLKEPVLSKTQINQLKSLEIMSQDMPIVTTVRYLGNHVHNVMMQYKMKNITEDQISTKETTNIEMMKAMEGIYELDTSINSQGDNLSFYLKRNQINLVSLFFQLAEHKIKPGDWWTVPMTITTLGSGHVAEEIGRVNRVSLDSVYNSEKFGRVGVISYVVVEYVKGKIDFRPNPEEGTPPFEYKSSYIAYGEFLIDKGTWKRYIGQMTIQGRGSKKTIDTTMQFALIPVLL